jgi:drug/metabolite transporter (DMT)-like permease
MQGFILLGVSIITTVLSQLLFKKEMLKIGNVDFSFRNIEFLIRQMVVSPLLLTGILLYGISFLLWLMVLSKIKLSIVYPITAMNFILVITASYFLYNEKLTTIQYGGAVLIITGVFLLAKI